MFKIAIPTYNRLNEISNKTLKFLNNHNIDKSMVDIFIGTEEEKIEYEKVIGEYNFILHGQCGIGAVRNYIRHHYKYKTDEKYILYLDDDIDDVILKNKEEEFNLYDYCLSMFKKTDEELLSLWGIAPYENDFWLKENITKNNRYIIGAFCGEVIRRDRHDIYTDLDHGEDIQFSLEYFIRDGGVLRDNSKGLKTKYFAGGGIVNSYKSLYNRLLDMTESSLYINNRYGDMVSLKKKTSLRKKKLPFKLEYILDIRFNNYYKL